MSGHPGTLDEQRPGGTVRRRIDAGSLVTVALWVVAVAVALVLAHQRYRGAIGPDPLRYGNDVDFETFLQAARSVAHGGSPYAGSAQYIYFAPLSLALAPFVHDNPVHLLQAWSILGLLAFFAALALMVGALRDRLAARWQVPVLFMVGSVIGLHSWPLVDELFLGNDDLIVLVAVVGAALLWRAGRPAWFGVLVGVICLIKVWPAVVILAVLQVGVDARRRMLAAGALAGMVTLGLLTDLIPAGRREFTGFVHAVAAAKDQHLVSESVVGVPKLLFSRSGLARPVVVSTTLRDLATAVLAAWVVALVVVCLRTRSEPLLVVLNLALAAVLLVPISHLCYAILALPVVWFWLANYGVVITPDPPGRSTLITRVAVAGSVLVWVVVQSRAWPGDGSPAGIASYRFCVPFAASVLLTTASVLGGRLLSVRPGAPGRQDAVDAGGGPGREADGCGGAAAAEERVLVPAEGQATDGPA